MTSPGIKRPLDPEFSSHAPDQNNDESATSAAVAASVVMKTELDVSDRGSRGGSKDEMDPLDGQDGTVAIKRRCTDTYLNSSPTFMDPTSQCERTSTAQAYKSHQSDQKPQMHPQRRPTSRSPPAKDPSYTKSSLDEEISVLIKDELCKTQQNLDTDHQTQNEPLILTERQTHSICGKLVRDREKKLREQFDRELACKLAEQYDLFAKANYLTTFAESSRVPTGLPLQTAPQTTAAVAAMAAAADHPAIKSAMAAAFIQRSAASPIVSPASTPSPLLSAASSMPNLTSMAASFTSNGHSVGLAKTHHNHATAYNLQQQQAAAAAVLRQAQQEQHYLQNQQRRISMPPNGPISLGPVLLASSLDEQLAQPEALFTLFGVFGDVIRVKILFNKKDNALIQMADANQAHVAQLYLDKQRIFGKVVRVSPSKHQVVQMPRDGSQSDAGLTKDFTNSPLHRFKIPGSRNYSNIYPPSNTLHISNIPATVEESDLHKAFQDKCGFEFSSFKFFPRDRKMALMRFASVEQATIALIKMHNSQISEENNLRVSFSKSSL